MSRISLTASMRSNLLSLQNISRQVDSTQNRLSTGKKVNSAIDNPSSYYTARSLTNRASDLDGLLDSIGQAVSTIKAATEALESAADFLEQAKAVATQTLENSIKEDDIKTANVSTKEELIKALNDENIKTIIIMNSITFDDDEFISISSGKTLKGISNEVSLNFKDTSQNMYVYGVTLENDAVLKDISINFTKTQNTGYGAAVNGGHLQGIVNINSLGDYAKGTVQSTLDGTVNIKTYGYDGSGVAGGTINGVANIIALGTSSMGVSTGQINEKAVVNVFSKQHLGIAQVNIKSGAEIWCADNGAVDLQQYIINADISNVNSSSFSTYATGKKASSDEFIKDLENKIDNSKNQVSSIIINTDSSQYTSILSQYDSLIKDAGYKGVNLLQEQDLKVTFNEGRTAWLDVLGKDASSAALGLTTLEWNTKADVEKSIEELTNATNQIRSMSSELGSYYNIVLNRQDFTENLINVLEEGADKLTLADMNEESANMLALQTRQQLAINSLSLASQAAQGILRLF